MPATCSSASFAAVSSRSQWAERLFEGVSETAVNRDLQVVAVCEPCKEAPLGHVSVWRQPSPEAQRRAEAAAEAAAAAAEAKIADSEDADPEGDAVDDSTIEDGGSFLICCDILNDDEYELLQARVAAMCVYAEPPELLLLLPRMPPASDRAAIVKLRERMEVLMDKGIDEVVAEQASGWLLCLHINAKFSASIQKLEDAFHTYQLRRQNSFRSTRAKHLVDFMMWSYLPPKVTTMLPRIAHNLHPSPLNNAVAGHTFLKRLGGGFYGQVYASAPTATVEAAARDQVPVSPTDAIKVVQKEGLVGIRELKMLHNMILVQHLLSSAQFQHPNITALRNIYHSPTHIFFRMEYAGAESLYSRLLASNSEVASGPKYRPITYEGLRAILVQSTAAIAHMHGNIGACHRDIKLENFVVAAGTAGAGMVPTIKLVDFDFALLVTDPNASNPTRNRCYGKSGTVPNVAPEIAFERSYDGMAADVWSLGIFNLEVLCGVRVLETALGIQHKFNGKGCDGVLQAAELIRGAFRNRACAARLLASRLRAEAAPLREGADGGAKADALLSAMLNLQPESRPSMEIVEQMVQDLPLPATTSSPPTVKLPAVAAAADLAFPLEHAAPLASSADDAASAGGR